MTETPLIVLDGRGRRWRGDAYGLLEIWYEYGLVAVLAFTALLGTVAYRLFNQMKGNLEDRRRVHFLAMAGFFIMLQVMLISGLYLINEFEFVLSLFFAETLLLGRAEPMHPWKARTQPAAACRPGWRICAGEEPAAQASGGLAR